MDVGNNSSTDVEYKYDALGRRVARVGSSGSFVYVQSDQQTIADYGVGDAPSSPLYRYVYASYIDEPVVRKGAGTGGTIHYYHRNQQYSVTAVTTSAGAIAERYAYSAYGEPTICDGSGSQISNSSINNRYSYTGREWDATVGLYHFRARWMSPKSGRFLTRDPIGFEGGSLNVQEYCHSKPFIYMDPTGMQLLANPLPPVAPPPPVVPVVGVGVGVGTAGGGITAGGCVAAVGPAVVPGTILGLCIYECPVIGTKCTLQGPMTRACYYICPVKCPPKAKTIDHCLGLSDDDDRAGFCNGLSPAWRREECRRHIYESQNNWNNYCRYLYLP
ncbi:MAG: RHS repeat domain-containing protein [Pirellula sp.]